MSEPRNFMKMVQVKHNEGKFVCVGLDPQLDKIPEALQDTSIRRTIFRFLKEIVIATSDTACAFKPNFAFFEKHGVEGLMALGDIIDFIKTEAPDVPIILDAKRGDIGKTNMGSVDMAFNWMEADAITLHPYLGKEAMKPFLDQEDKGIIILCRTSNPGAGEFQDLMVVSDKGGEWPLYQVVANRVADYWNDNGNCLVVAGATYPEELRIIRQIIGNMPMLIPGIGAQGGDLEKTVEYGKNNRGQGMIISSSSGVIHASTGSDFAEAARAAALELHNTIRDHLGLPVEILT